MSFPALARDAHFDKEKALDLLKKVNLGQYDLNSKIEHLSEVNVKDYDCTSTYVSSGYIIAR